MSQTYNIEPVHNSVINLHGWRIVRGDGAVLLPFHTKAEAERLVEFFVDPFVNGMNAALAEGRALRVTRANEES